MGCHNRQLTLLDCVAALLVVGGFRVRDVVQNLRIQRLHRGVLFRFRLGHNAGYIASSSDSVCHIAHQILPVPREAAKPLQHLGANLAVNGPPCRGGRLAARGLVATHLAPHSVSLLPVGVGLRCRVEHGLHHGRGRFRQHVPCARVLRRRSLLLDGGRGRRLAKRRRAAEQVELLTAELLGAANQAALRSQ